MRVKPKEILVNLPAVHTFDQPDQDALLAGNFNTFLHGKVRLKYEQLGMLGGQYVSIFYLQRNNEFSELRQQFMQMIEAEEANLLPEDNISSCCKQVPECNCGNCRDPYNGHTP